MIGSQIQGGRFTVVRRLGAGGMGEVFEARDNERNLPVALKSLPHLDPTALYRFKQEFRALTELIHPNLVPLYELFSEGDRWFITMELVADPVAFFPKLASARAPGSSGSPGAAKRPTTLTPARPGTRAPETTSDDETIVATAPARSQPEIDPSETVASSAPIVSDAEAETVFIARTDAAAPTQSGGVTFARLPASPAAEADAEAALPAFDLTREVFRQLAAGVTFLHQAGKLHRDLKPGNVMVGRQGKVTVLDFGLVMEVEDEASGAAEAFRTTDSDTTAVSGTIAYMAPEQAAGQPLTPAADWYAVGAMLFQTLTGKLPFSGRATEILRRKQVEEAPPPRQLRPEIPTDLAALCSDLLRLDPSSRPTGPEVLRRLAGESASVSASPAAPRGSQAPFVGRHRELVTLQEGLAALARGQTVLGRIQGRSGAGKSALVRHFLDAVAEDPQAVILVGRCYEQESVPYKALDSLIDALTRHLLRLSAAQLTALLPPETGALATVFPVLNRVPGIAQAAQGYTASTDPRATRRQASQALRSLLRRLGERHRLVLYIDDMQWGDLDSAALLAELLSPPDAPHLLLILGYRSEYEQTSGCLKKLAAWQAAEGAALTQFEVRVNALTPEETLELALALLGGDTPAHRQSAEWVVRESGGGAFLIYELVRHLQAGGQQETGGKFDLDEILWRRASGLPTEARQLLEVVAVAGAPLRLRVVQDAGGLTALSPQVLALLRSAQFVRTSGPGLEAEVETYHDRVRESITARLPADTRRQRHAALAGRLRQEPDAEPETIAHHYDGAGETNEAGRFYSQAAEAAKRVLAFERAEEFYRKATAQVADPFERADVSEKLIHFYTDMARFRDAYDFARTAIQPFGVKLPKSFIPPLFIADFIQAKFRMRGRRPADLLELPLMQDRQLATGVRLINAVAKAAYQIRPELCVAVSTRAVNLCLKHGNTPDSAIGYMVHGVIFLGGVLGGHQIGYEMGRLALDMVEKYQQHGQRAEVQFVVGYFGTAWLRPATEVEALWRRAWQSGQETRDLFHSGCASAGLVMSLWMRGAPLDEVWAETERHLDFLQRAGLREPLGVVRLVRQVVKNLRGQTPRADSLDDDTFQEETFLGELAGYGSRHFAHFCRVLLTQFHRWRGQPATARVHARASHVMLKESPGMLHGAEHYLQQALAQSAGTPGPGARSMVAKAQKRFRKWAKSCPENFAAKELLLTAELHRLAGANSAAAAAYAETAALAERHGNHGLSALAHDLAARLSPSPAAQAAARAAYQRFGANALAATPA